MDIQGASSETHAFGQLVVRADNAAPGSVPVSISSKPDLLAGADDPLWISGFIAVVLFVVGLAIADNRTHIGKAFPAVKFEFGSSFATTLTTLGAVLRTVLGASVLPTLRFPG